MNYACIVGRKANLVHSKIYVKSLPGLSEVVELCFYSLGLGHFVAFDLVSLM